MFKQKIIQPLLITGSILTTLSPLTVFADGVALGDTLSQPQKAQMLDFLGTDIDRPEEALIVSGVEINQLLQDGSNRDTAVFSSVATFDRPEGYGVHVQILTPDYIEGVSAPTYQNVSLTAGLSDTLIKIASPVAVSGEGALAGLFVIEGHHLPDVRKQLAQEELSQIYDFVTTGKVSESEYAQFLLDAKLAVLESDTDLNEDSISKLVQAMYRQHNDPSFGEGVLEWTAKFLTTFSALDNDGLAHQIKASDVDTLTKEQAADLFELTDHYIRKRTIPEDQYDRELWQEVEVSDTTITLQYDDRPDYFNFYIGDGIANLTVTTEPLGKGDNILSFQFDTGNGRTLALTDHRIVNDINPEEKLLEYFRIVISPESEGQEAKVYNESKDPIYAEVAFEVPTEDGTHILPYRVHGTGLIEILPYEVMGEWGLVQDIAPHEVEREGRENNSSTTIPEPLIEASHSVMSDFANKMNQQYNIATLEDPYNMAGMLFPNEVMDHLAINGESVSASYGEDQGKDVTVVAAYQEAINGPVPHHYLLALVDGQPLVLHSQQNQGMPDGKIHFHPTENQELQRAFQSLFVE